MRTKEELQIVLDKLKKREEFEQRGVLVYEMFPLSVLSDVIKYVMDEGDNHNVSCIWDNIRR